MQGVESCCRWIECTYKHGAPESHKEYATSGSKPLKLCHVHVHVHVRAINEIWQSTSLWSTFTCSHILCSHLKLWCLTFSFVAKKSLDLWTCMSMNKALTLTWTLTDGSLFTVLTLNWLDLTWTLTGGKANVNIRLQSHPIRMTTRESCWPNLLRL
jgi:hypothetical protein